MKSMKLMISLFVLMITLFATASMAVTVQELADSPLTIQQKHHVTVKIIEGDEGEAQTLFEELSKKASIKAAIEYKAQLQAKMKAETDAKLAADQAKYSKKLISKIADLKIEDVWAEAIAYVDFIGAKHQKFIANFLAKRYSLKGEFDTIDSVKTAYNQRSADMKAKAGLEAEMQLIATKGDVEVLEVVAALVLDVGILKQDLENTKIDLVSMASDLASVTQAEKEDSTKYNALVKFVSNDKDDKELFETILQQEKDKAKDVTQ